MSRPEAPICDYEGSDYQATFWDRGERQYEDQVEAIAIRRLLPRRGALLLEVGAGAGRNTERYRGFDRVVLVDFSRSQLELAQSRVGGSDRYVFVAADIYDLPFVDGLFDAATMIRVLHHMADAPAALRRIRDVLAPGGAFVLEFANKTNLKAILRYLLGMQRWNPFDPEPVEFARLNFDFHPRAVEGWLRDLGFRIERRLTVSHFRAALLKRIIPVGALVFVDSILQPTGAIWQLTPSVFLLARVGNPNGKVHAAVSDVGSFFRCPTCGNTPMEQTVDAVLCGRCGSRWDARGGIYDFRQPLGDAPRSDAGESE